MHQINYALLVGKIRVARGLTQEDLAHELDVTVGTLNGWENGRHRPVKAQRKRLEAMAAGLGLPLVTIGVSTRVPGGQVLEGGRDED
jgi:transcriptional regulator with XRE-family HTH domain